jgi:mRNA interferase MazF
LVIGLPMTHAESNESNPFAMKHVGPKGEVAYILTHRPKSFDWRERGARPHPWKQLLPTVIKQVCEGRPEFNHSDLRVADQGNLQHA